MIMKTISPSTIKDEPQEPILFPDAKYADRRASDKRDTKEPNFRKGLNKADHFPHICKGGIRVTTNVRNMRIDVIVRSDNCAPSVLEDGPILRRKQRLQRAGSN